MPEQQAEETGAEKARGKPAKQSAAEETRPSRRLADRAGLARLRHASLDRSGGIRRRVRNRRRGESPCAPAAARGSAACTGIRISGNQHERRGNRGKCNKEPVSKHRAVSPTKMARIEYVYSG